MAEFLKISATARRPPPRCSSWSPEQCALHLAAHAGGRAGVRIVTADRFLAPDRVSCSSLEEFLLYAVFPSYYALISSLENGAPACSTPPSCPAPPISATTRRGVSQRSSPSPGASSLLPVAAGTVAATLFLAVLAAYALGRTFAGRRGGPVRLTVSMSRRSPPLRHVQR